MKIICKATITSISALLFSTAIPATCGFSILHTNTNGALQIKNPSILGLSAGTLKTAAATSSSSTTTTTLYSSPEDESSLPPLQFESAASKFFQLEEKEDKDSSTTEVFLSTDGTVTMGETDAPPPLRATGTWSQDGQHFKMNIKRTFGAGQSNTDVGEFKFVVERAFVGHMDTVGNLLSIDGSMHLKDEFTGDVEVGFFSMIDTTNARLMEDDIGKKGTSLSM